MGNLLKLLQKEDNNCNCVNNARFPDVFIDFVNAKPNPEDAEEISENMGTPTSIYYARPGVNTAHYT